MTMGFFVQSTTHFSFYATVGTPEVEDSFYSGIYNVYTAWYTLDSQVTAFWVSKELLEGGIAFLILGGSIAYFNRTSMASFGFIAGVIQIIAAYFYVAFQSIILGYAVVNSVYIQTRYDTLNPVKIQFGTLFNAFSGTGENAWLESLIYLEQLFIGNKRLALYNNIIMATALALHPITLPFAFYFIGQLPFQIILDVFVYPFFPQFDTPQVPWEEVLV